MKTNKEIQKIEKVAEKILEVYYDSYERAAINHFKEELLQEFDKN